MSSLAKTTLHNLLYIREGLYTKRSRLHLENAPLAEIFKIDEHINNTSEEIIKLRMQLKIADDYEEGRISL